MSFEDLPADWPQRPLTEPQLVADVLDLCVSEAARHDGCLAVLLCDEQARLLQPCLVSDIDQISTEADRLKACTTFAIAAAHIGAGVLFALGRRRGLSVTADDEAWARVARQACAGTVAMLGFHVITHAGSRPIPIGEQAA